MNEFILVKQQIKNKYRDLILYYNSGFMKKVFSVYTLDIFTSHLPVHTISGANTFQETSGILFGLDYEPNQPIILSANDAKYLFL